MRQTQSITIILSCSVEVSRIETTSVQAAAEAPLEHEWDATRFEPVRSSFWHPSKSCSFRWAIRTNVMNWIAVHLTFLVLCTLFCLRSRLPHYVKIQFISPLKAELLIWLKGVNFCGVLFCGFFFLRELIFVDQGQSAKFARIRTRKIFMLHGSSLLKPCWWKFVQV